MTQIIAVKLQAIIADQLGIDEAEVQSDANILDDLGADSLDVVELVMVIEEAFQIEIPDEAVEAMRTIGDVDKYVTSRVSAQA
jgi:acyl carrier protein